MLANVKTFLIVDSLCIFSSNRIVKIGRVEALLGEPIITDIKVYWKRSATLKKLTHSSKLSEIEYEKKI